MGFTLYSAPDDLPLTVDEVKAHLRIDGTDEDAYLTALIGAATEHVQNYTNRQLMQATYLLTLTSLDESITIPYKPFANTAGFTAKDKAGVEIEEPAFPYMLSGTEPAVFTLVSDYDVDAIGRADIRFTVGYNSKEDIPKPIIQAMLLIIGYWYNNREDGNDRFPKASEALLNSYRYFNF